VFIARQAEIFVPDTGVTEWLRRRQVEKLVCESFDYLATLDGRH
jgi:hypothetical protein